MSESSVKPTEVAIAELKQAYEAALAAQAQAAAATSENDATKGLLAHNYLPQGYQHPAYPVLPPPTAPMAWVMPGAYPMDAPYYPTYGAPPPQAFPQVQPPDIPHDALLYFGVPISDPTKPQAPKVPGYEAFEDYKKILLGTASGAPEIAFKELIKVLLRLTPPQVEVLKEYYWNAQHGSTLTDAVVNATNSLGHLRDVMRGITLGPLQFDVYLARTAVTGLITDSTLLIELLLGRPVHEIKWLKTAYMHRYGRDLAKDIESRVKGKSEREMFRIALAKQKPVSGASVDMDVVALHTASLKSTDRSKAAAAFFEILLNRSDEHIAKVIELFGSDYRNLSRVIKKYWSGTVRDGLLFVVHGVKPKREGKGFRRDAKMLEESMAGLGTKDQRLVYRLLRAHWIPERFSGIKEAYQLHYGKTLYSRVWGETSGLYRDALVSIVNNSDSMRTGILLS